MKRRESITLLGSAAAAWPLAARAQQAMPAVGFLHQGSLRSYAHGADNFRRGLQETGYVEGRNVRFEFRWADGQYERLPELADDLVRRRPNVIVAALLPAVRAVKAATATIPIVFISGSDPIEAGLVTSMNRPTENVTGVSLFSVPLISKRLELLHEVVPAAATVGVLMNPSNPNAKSNERGIESAARLMGLTVKFILASGDQDFEPAFLTIVQQQFRRRYRERRWLLRQQTRAAGRIGGAPSCSSHVLSTGVRLRRRADQLWCKLPRHVSPGRCLCRPYPQGRDSRGLACHAAEQN
jgi:ABC-type uncharacterized transport system substrate-binding protein